MGGIMLRSMCCSFGFILIAFGPGIGTRPLQGQTISLFREFSTPQIDRASAITADATGVYVFGERPASDDSLSSAAVSKFDSRGTSYGPGLSALLSPVASSLSARHASPPAPTRERS